MSSDGSLDSPTESKQPNKSGTRPRNAINPTTQNKFVNLSKCLGIGSRRAGLQSEDALLDSESDESDLEAEDPRLQEGSDSDVTIEEWHNESRTWQLGPGSNNRSVTRNDQLIKPIPAHVSEDDF